MPCLQGPTIPIPSLPFPLSIPDLAIPSLSFDANLCCKIAVATPVIPIPIPIGGLLAAVGGAAFINIIIGYIDAINAFLDTLTISCPLD